MGTIKLYSHLGNSMRKYFLAMRPVCIFPNVSWDFAQPKAKKKSTSHQSKGIRACHCKSDNTAVPVKKIYSRSTLYYRYKYERQLVLEELCSQRNKERASFIQNDSSTLMVPLLIQYSTHESNLLCDANISTKHNV